jgi:sulfur carrier protein
MKIQINGDLRELIEAGTIEESFVRLGIPLDGVLVEHNGVALHRSEWRERIVRDGDVIEVIRIVAGG